MQKVTIRLDRDVLRLEAPDRQALMTVPPVALVDKRGTIYRAGLRDEDEDELREYEPILQIVRPLAAPVDTTMFARLVHHVVFEFLRRQRERPEGGAGFALTDRAELEMFGFSRLSAEEQARFASDLRRIPMIQRLTIDGEELFEKGKANHPLARFFLLAATIGGGALLLLLPLFGLGLAFRESEPGIRNFVGLGIAILAFGACAAYLVWERRQGYVSNMTVVLFSAIMLLLLLQFLSW